MWQLQNIVRYRTGGNPVHPLLVLIIIIPALAGCAAGSNARCAPPLPTSRPAGFTLSYGVSGGMLPRGSTLTIGEAECLYTVYFNGTTKTITFQLSGAELDELYKSLVDNRFDRIETVEEEILDRGGNTISVSWRGGSCSVSNSGLTFIKEGWSEEWNRILEEVERMRLLTVERASVAVTFVADPSIRGLRVTLALDETTLLQDSLVQTSGDGGNLTVAATTIPGDVVVQTSFDTGSWSQLPIKVQGGERFRLVRRGEEIHVEVAE